MQEDADIVVRRLCYFDTDTLLARPRAAVSPARRTTRFRSDCHCCGYRQIAIEATADSRIMLAPGLPQNELAELKREATMRTRKQLLAFIAVLLSFTALTLPAQAASPENTHTVTLYVHSPGMRGTGVHIFDGSVIEARRVSDNKRIAIQRADRNGRVIFKLRSDSYRFGPAEGLEKRLEGNLQLYVGSDMETDLELTLR